MIKTLERLLYGVFIKVEHILYSFIVFMVFCFIHPNFALYILGCTSSKQAYFQVAVGVQVIENRTTALLILHITPCPLF